MPVRKALGVRTIFNILGPLSNPAGAPAQVMGVYAPQLVPLVAEAMAMLGTRHALVVHGDGNLDEFSPQRPQPVRRSPIRDRPSRHAHSAGRRASPQLRFPPSPAATSSKAPPSSAASSPEKKVPAATSFS